MNQTVNGFIIHHQLLAEDDHIFIAVSGGADSMALLHYLSEQSNGRWRISVGHVEHGLRGEASIGDLHFVEDYCKKNDIPFYYHQPNVMQLKKERGISTQEAARICRYDWLDKKMKIIEANKLALAHHGDDQIETILMRQVRGSLSGLKGIPVQRPFSSGKLIRPFLCLEKKEIYQYCKRNKILYREDESNNSEIYQRNRFRKVILPFLKEENPKVHDVFQRQSEQFEEDNRYLQWLTEKEVKKVITIHSNHKLGLNIKRFFEIPIALQRRAIHLILSYLSSIIVGHHVTSRHLDDILDLMKKGSSSWTLHLPHGIQVEQSYDECFFVLGKQEKQNVILEKKEIGIPGMVLLNQGKIEASIINTCEECHSNGNQFVFLADLNKLSAPLYIRNRKQGDRITPIGLNGSKKVKDIFIDEKIPQREREQWPIIVNQLDDIVWIPQLKRSNIALRDESTKEMVQLVYHPLMERSKNV